jgi:hypothetical protein
MTTLMASVNAALPKISYMKSIDIYLGVCFFMVFGALIEYACVGYCDKRIQLRKNRFLAMQKMLEEKRQEALKQVRYFCSVKCTQRNLIKGSVTRDLRLGFFPSCSTYIRIESKAERAD